MFCNVCGHNLGNDGEGTCRNCGATKAMRQAQHNLDSNQGYDAPAAPPSPFPPPYPTHNPYAPHLGHHMYRPGKGKATASLVLGICSIVFSWVPFAGLILGIVGLVMASLAKREGFIGGIRSGGLVCSIIGTVFASFYTIVIFVGCTGAMFYMW